MIFFIELETRRVHLARITTNPDSPRTAQAARNLLMKALILLCQCGEVFEEDGVEASG